jgi:hypothetical protein
MPLKRPQKPADGPEHLSDGHGRKSAAVREQAILALFIRAHAGARGAALWCR